MNVAPEVAPAHLESLNDFAIEIRRGFDELRERSHYKRRVPFDGTFGVEVTNPAGLQGPDLFSFQPLRAIGKDAALHLESDRIEFDDAEAAEEFLLGVEEVVVVDLGTFAKDPSLRTRIGLCRLAFDLVTQGVLALVGVGEIGVVEKQEQPGEHHARDEQRQGQAIEADAAGLESDDFVVLAEYPEGDERGDQGAEG